MKKIALGFFYTLMAIVISAGISQAADLSGIISYSGTPVGTIYVTATNDVNSSLATVYAVAYDAAPVINYTLSDLSDDTYTVIAYLDSDGDGLRGATEPVGQPVESVVVTAANVVNVNFSVAEQK